MSTLTNNHKTWVEISKEALENNIRVMRGLLACPVRDRPSLDGRSHVHVGAVSNGASGTTLMAVVKANAYGHGLKEISSALKREAGIMFGVDSLEEALAVKSVVPKNEIIILGYIPERDLPIVVKNSFHFSVYDGNMIRSLVQLTKTNRIKRGAIKAHLKIETGTNRLGIDTGELKNIVFEFPIAGVYTHFADSENLSSSFHKEQIGILNEAIEILKNKGINPQFIHSACTAAAMRGVADVGNLARIGIGFYGLWPTEELKEKFSQKINPAPFLDRPLAKLREAQSNERCGIKLKPVLSWKTRIAQIKHIQKGETVGYDRTHKVKKETSIAILPVGYYDGYDRKLSQCSEVIINGKRARVAGRICMNMTMVDLSGIKARTGDEVILIGKSGKEQITVEELAEKIGTINYEVVSRINPLLPRIYSD